MTDETDRLRSVGTPLLTEEKGHAVRCAYRDARGIEHVSAWHRSVGEAVNELLRWAACQHAVVFDSSPSVCTVCGKEMP